MRIDKIYYRLNALIGNGASENFTIVAEPEEGDSLDECFSELREWARKAKLPTEDELYERLRRGENALNQLEIRIEEKKRQWNEVRTFLIAQGINPNAPEMPLPVQVLPQSLDGEVVEKDI